MRVPACELQIRTQLEGEGTSSNKYLSYASQNYSFHKYGSNYLEHRAYRQNSLRLQTPPHPVDIILQCVIICAFPKYLPSVSNEPSHPTDTVDAVDDNVRLAERRGEVMKPPGIQDLGYRAVGREASVCLANFKAEQYIFEFRCRIAVDRSDEAEEGLVDGCGRAEGAVRAVRARDCERGQSGTAHEQLVEMISIVYGAKIVYIERLQHTTRSAEHARQGFGKRVRVRCKDS
ncbi:hypothetical protein OE88DRAFT_1090054 [Heliocybe sulcata]|uniref:Uncharacterized protein n=1 Tax=Heliocybe sulcata TaxID=5364 RepID=A0A5C3MKE2_9AGAM|nr:hypothetical protein OE88DRAFT_1090054 [Heliocybe sulcata]